MVIVFIIKVNISIVKIYFKGNYFTVTQYNSMDSKCLRNNQKSVTTYMTGPGSRMTAQQIIEPTVAPTGCDSPLITRNLRSDNGYF